jgi:hypothetical protein
MHFWGVLDPSSNLGTCSYHVPSVHLLQSLAGSVDLPDLDLDGPMEPDGDTGSIANSAEVKRDRMATLEVLTEEIGKMCIVGATWEAEIPRNTWCRPLLKEVEKWTADACMFRSALEYEAGGQGQHDMDKAVEDFELILEKFNELKTAVDNMAEPTRIPKRAASDAPSPMPDEHASSSASGNSRDQVRKARKVLFPEDAQERDPEDGNNDDGAEL